MHISPAHQPLRLTDRKRQAIVDAAIAEFRAFGFEATSMDKIAATAGVSKRTVYNHFPSKDELFTHILLELWESSAALMAIPYQPGAAFPQFQQNMRKQFILAGEVVVDGALGHAGRGRDLVHAGRFEAEGAEFGDGGVDDGLALAVGQAQGLISGRNMHGVILHRVVYFSKNKNYTV